MHAAKMAALALLMAIHTIAGTGEDDATPHVREEATEMVADGYTRKEDR